MNFLDRNIHKDREIMQSISKRLLHINSVNESKGVTQSSNPLFLKNTNKQMHNPDIRYQSVYRNDALSNIHFRNSLLLFSENKEIKKAIKIYINEILVTNLKTKKYPVYPVVNTTLLSEDKLELANTMQQYLDEVFYPKVWRWLGFHIKDGLKEKLEEYIKCGKLAFEIVYDNIKKPKDIVNIYPIDPSYLQKYRSDYQTWYIYRDNNHNGTEKILHESQIILIEYNKYDFGYMSMVDSVRRSFNIMRGMQTSKVGWFAAKSQVRIHINMAMGDMPRAKAEQEIYNQKSELMTTCEFDSINGVVYFNGENSPQSYVEYITAETTNSGKPEIEEIIGTGVDLSETDSLTFWQKQYWSDWEIPYDRVDPSSVETWGFGEPSQLKKSEVNFSKNCLDIKEDFAEIFKQIIITQFTLKEAEIGVDLSLLDSIEINWVTFNEYEAPAELEMLSKRIDVAKQIIDFGQAEDADGRMRNIITPEWVMHNYLSDIFTPDQIKSLKKYSLLSDKRLGYISEDNNLIVTEKSENSDKKVETNINPYDDGDEDEDEDFMKSIADVDGDNFS